MADLAPSKPTFFARPPGRVLKHLFWWTLFVGFEYFVFSNWQEKPIVTWGFVLKDTVAARPSGRATSRSTVIAAADGEPLAVAS